MRMFTITAITACCVFVFTIAAVKTLDAQGPKEKIGTIMDSYTGQTVNISGKVFTEDNAFEGGVILILAKTGMERHSLILQKTTIFGPSAYSLRVPKDFGDIYILAINIDHAKGRTILRGVYGHNPIKVGSLGIKDVNIILRKDLQEKIPRD